MRDTIGKSMTNTLLHSQRPFTNRRFVISEGSLPNTSILSISTWHWSTSLDCAKEPRHVMINGPHGRPQDWHARLPLRQLDPVVGLIGIRGPENKTTINVNFLFFNRRQMWSSAGSTWNGLFWVCYQCCRFSYWCIVSWKYPHNSTKIGQANQSCKNMFQWTISWNE